MVFVDMNNVQFYPILPAVNLPSSQRIVPTVEERLMAAFQHRDGDELPRTSRESMREERSRDATAVTKDFKVQHNRVSESEDYELPTIEELLSPITRSEKHSAGDFTRSRQETYTGSARPASNPGGCSFYPSGLDAGGSQDAPIVLEEDIPDNAESSANGDGFHSDGFGPTRSDASSSMGSNSGCDSTTPATTLDGDGTCINDIDIPATEISEMLRSSSRERDLTFLYVDDSNRDREASSRVGSGSPIQKDGLQQNDSRISTDTGTVRDVNDEDIGPLQSPRKRRKPTPAKRNSKAQLRRQGRRHTSLTPSTEDSERSSYEPADEDNTKQSRPSRIHRRNLKRKSPSSILVAAGVTSEAGTAYREWPLQGFLKRINIGGQLSYTMEFGLHHDSISVASPVRSNPDNPTTTIPRAKRPRLRATRSYEVERVIDKQVSSAGTMSYLVRWKGYGPEFDEWKPASAMAEAKDLVEEYERRMSAATPHYPATLISATPVPAKRGRGRPRKVAEG